MATDEDVPNGLDKKLEQRQANSNPLNTIPSTSAQPHGRIPNTPLAASTISFVLGSVFTIGLFTFLNGGFGHRWLTYQLGFFMASWAAFHWGEFAVTAGWNLEKCSVDCMCPSSKTYVSYSNPKRFYWRTAISITSHTVLLLLNI